MRAFIFPVVVAGTLLAAGRANAQTELYVPLHPQETNVWCYAATTQMIADYLGSKIDQCVIASHSNGGIDCCPAPGQDIPDACKNGGRAVHALAYWGFPGTQNPPLGYADIKTEIDAQRPIAVGIEWPTGAHHEVVVDGYWTESDGTHHVHILNPLPVNKGDSEWVTYDVLLNGGTEDNGEQLSSHTVSVMTAQLHWKPVCSVDFDDLDAELYKQCWDQHVHHQEWPASLSSGDDKMAGNWRGSHERPVSWNSSLADLESRVSVLSSSERPEQITVNSDNETYNAIWVAESHPWTTNFSSTKSTLYSDDGTFNNEGYVMTDLYGYNITGTPKYTATWVKESGSYHFDVDISLATFQAEATTLRNEGYMLTRVSTFTDETGGMRVAALWRPMTVSSYAAIMNQSPTSYQTNYDTYTTAGYTLVYTSMLSDSQINAIFTK